MPSPYTPLVKNNDVLLKRMLYRIPYNAFVLDEVTDTLATLTAAAPAVTEISTFGMAGLAMTANDTAIAQDLNFLQIADITKAIDVRVLWTTNGAPVATDGATFIVLYDQVDPGEAIVAPATALDTVLVEHVEGGDTAYVLHRTAAGVIAANSFDENARLGMLSFDVELDAVTTFDGDQVIFLGLELAYTPQYFANINDLSTRHTSQGASTGITA